MTSLPLPADRCRDLLRRRGVGRIAFSDRAMPAIAVAAYAVQGHDLELRVPASARLVSALRDAVVAVGVDDVEAGWSVTVTGATHGLRTEADDVVVLVSIDVVEGTAVQESTASAS